MPRKTSIKLAAQSFKKAAAETDAYVAAASQLLTAAQASRAHDGAVISLYRDFENLILNVLAGAINNDTRTVSATQGVGFPKHLTNDVCRYIITGPSYFDFKGRPGLISRVKQYVPQDHFLVTILKDQKYSGCLEQLCSLRNFAAHSSPQSKKAVLQAVGQKKMKSAGSWLKCKGRFPQLVGRLIQLSDDIEAAAPY